MNDSQPPPDAAATPPAQDTAERPEDHPYYPPEKERGQKRMLPIPELRQKIVDVINVTGSDQDAFTLAGVSRQTFYNWINEGKACKAKGFQCCFVDFLDAVERARIGRKISLVGNIRKAGTEAKHWTANAWILERTEAREYAKQIRVHINEELTGALTRLQQALPPDQFELACAAIAEGDRGPGAEPDSSGEGGEDDTGGEAVPATPAQPETDALPGSDV